LDELIGSGERAIESGETLSAASVLERFFDLMTSCATSPSWSSSTQGSHGIHWWRTVADQAERLVA